MAENKKKSKVVAKAKVRDEDKPRSSGDEPDEFVAGVNRWAEALRPHALKIAIAVGLVAVLLVGFATLRWVKERSAARATASFVAALEAADRPVREPGEDGAEPVAAPDEPAPYASAEERARQVLAHAEAVEAKGGLGAAAALVRARALMELERFADAAREFATAASGELPEPARLAAREGVGYAYEAEAERAEDPAARTAAFERALEAFRDMQPAEDGPRRDWALYHEARVLATLGKRDEARASYQKILETLPDTVLKGDIEIRLAALGAGANAPAPSPDPTPDEPATP